MGRGTSKAGGGSGGSTVKTYSREEYMEMHGAGASGGGSTKATNSVSGKSFNASDWKTWTPGTKIEYQMEGDYSFMDDTARQTIGAYWVDGTVKKVDGDHLIVDVPDVSDHMWLDEDFAEKYRVKRRK